MNPDDFKSRSKSVFDSLASLESVHNVKAKEYIDRTLDTFDPTEENEEKRSSTAVKRKDGEFKVPEIPPPLTICGPPRRSNFTPATSGGFKRRHNEPDHVRNPHKWKRYSLEDVKESDMSSSANIRAAMSFLNRSEKHEIDQNELKNIEFNRPIGKKRGDTREEKQPKSSTKSSLILDKVEEVEEKDESESPSKSEKKSEASGFKKKVAKSARKVNLRRNDDDEEVEPNEVEMTSSLATNKRSKEEDDDDEFKEYRNEKKNDDETSEFDDNYY